MGNSFEGLPERLLPPGASLYRGKVRDVVDLGDSLIIITSDRISAFDRSLGTIPGKGEILHQLSMYWFRQTKDIIVNHMIREVSGRAAKVRKAQVIPIEVIVRGYLTGSAWREYSAGRDLPGIKLPAGLKNNQAFDQPILTPTTKEEHGKHDEPISREEILRRGIVSESLWQEVEQKALALFARGQELLKERGLLLVDTKYEFGLVNGQLILVDEIHTPDSSRFWFADDYEASFAAGREPRKLDKEFLRSWLLAQGFSGDGPCPSIPREIMEETLTRYRDTYELITGEKFVSRGLGVEAETRQILSTISEK